MKNPSKPKWIYFSDVIFNLATCRWFWCSSFLVIKIWEFKEEQCLWQLDLRKMSLRRQIIFHLLSKLFDWWKINTSPILSASVVYLICLHAIWKQQFKCYFNEKNCPWLVWYCLKWVWSSHEMDKVFAWNIFWRTNPLFVATFSKVHREISFNCVFGCQNIANPPFLRKKGKH